MLFSNVKKSYVKKKSIFIVDYLFRNISITNHENNDENVDLILNIVNIFVKYNQLFFVAFACNSKNTIHIVNRK